MKSSPESLAIFDMDGTLTRPHLDFDRIRAEIGLSPGPILESVAALPPGQERERAEAILHRHEDEAARASELQPDAREVLAILRHAGWLTALMTRNSRHATKIVCDKHGLAFDHIRTREDGPTKPSPEPIFDICRALDRRSADAWTIGDFHFDIVCGNAAGTRTVLFWEFETARPPWAASATHVISSLRELPRVMGLREPH